MIVSPETKLEQLQAQRGLGADAVSGAGHYCPSCLRQVTAAQAEREPHHEACRSGGLDVALLHCPRCGLVLAVEVDVMGAGAPEQIGYSI